MLHWERATVIEEHPGWAGVSRGLARVDKTGETLKVLAFTELTGGLTIGETVLLNINALRRGLGTGGDALVVARPDHLIEAEPIDGHMMKARYTPVQTMVDAIDDPASEHYETVREAIDLGGMPVVVADLHSSLPAVVAGVRAEAPGARIAYIHTDAAALPATYSATAAALRENGLLTAVISAGQSFGGDLEAVTVHSALLGARHVTDADVAIVIQGPGNLGTGTGWGFSGVQAAEAVHAAHVLEGLPIAALRVSSADPRERHRGLSHHSATMFGRAALAPVCLPVLAPDDVLYSCFHASVTEQVQASIVGAGVSHGCAHRAVPVNADGLMPALESLPVRLSTMGRGLSEDPEAFLYAALAGRCAAAMLSNR